MKAHPALFEGEGGGAKKVSTNTFIPVYIHIHICTIRRVFKILEALDHYTLLTYTFNNIEWGGGGKKARNTFIPVYIHIHIQNLKTKL